MSRVRSLFFCLECGAESVRWEGRCPSCSAWNTLAEAPRKAPGGVPARSSGPGAAAQPLGDAAPPPPRLASGFALVDRVLGGGFVPGSVALLGGTPGIGKSTLLLQIAAEMHRSGVTVLYASGEESRDQVRLRADRLGGSAGALPFIASDRIEDVIDAAEQVRPQFLCVDSIQTVAAPGAGTPGGVSQVRESAARLQEFAKRTATATVLVGHVTKGGALAGPRTLEHVVDVVLHFEGPRAAEFRFLRSSKNRFGSVDEIAAFRMTETGLDSVEDPSGLFLSDRPDDIGGSAVAVSIHGSQPLLTEIQALTCAARFGSPQRMSTGFPPRRLAILLAVLERRGGIPLGASDVFLNVVGGGRLTDTGTDLAVVGALASSYLDRPLGRGSVLVAEVGLGGELRGVSAPEARVRAARRAGLKDVILPGAHRNALGTLPGIRFMEHVGELIDWVRST
ncbi:MAG: DNA repair protein RadA [Gemmatimonadota bacterium]|nr:DNA repair protein RadA [Gemmatimonadota bacterium]